MQTERYHCVKCDWFGTEPNERIEREYYDGHPRELAFVSCPECGSEELDEATPCEECGEHPAEVEDWCKDCHAALFERGLLIDL